MTIETQKMEKNRRHSTMLLLTVLVNLILLGGCMKKQNIAENPESTSSRKNTLRLNFIEGDVPSMVPHDLDLSARGCALGKWLFEGLTRLNLEGEYDLAGASSVEVSSDKKRYLFTLRHNYYCDGTLVSAQDYERSWKKALSSESGCKKAHLFYCIKNAEAVKKQELSIDKVGIKALDDNTLLVELSYPVPHFFSLLAMPLFAPYKLKEGKILSNGPYLIDRWQKDDLLVLKPNRFFWDRDNIGLEEIQIFHVKDSIASFDLYNNGEIDWIGSPFSPLPVDILSSQLSQGYLSEIPNHAAPFWIYINTNHFPLSSSLIRRALSVVLNRREIAEYIFHYPALFTPLSRYLSRCKDPIVDRDLSNGKELFMKGLEDLNLTPETFPTITLSCCHLSNNRKLAEYLQEKWQNAFGIKVHLNIQEWNSFYHDLQEGNYQIGGAFLGGDYNSPLAYLDQLAQDRNFPRWHHTEYCAIIRKIKGATDAQLKEELLEKAENIITTDAPIIPIVDGISYYSHHPDLKGVCFDFRGVPDLRWARFEKKQSESLLLHQD